MKCKITNGLCSYIHCPIYNHPEVYLNFKAECKNRESIDSDKEWKDKEVQIDRTMGQLGRLAQLSNEDLKEKVESLDKHKKRST